MNSESHPESDDRQVRPTLLIADDDPVVRSVLGSQLQGSFEFVGTATNTTDAIMLAQEHKPDCALIDLDMPGGGAVRAVPAICEVSPDTRTVVLSADESDQIVQQLLNAGAIAYVRKGVSGAEIADTLLAALRVDED
jgi:two-component system, NarL family, nitrate/nitrite response regulator NarL